MSNLSSLYRELRQYENLLSEVSQLSRTVGYAAESLEPAVSKIDSSFEIDEVSADNKQISLCREQLVTHKNSLSGSISSSIESKISQIRREIEELEREEAERTAMALKG